jgi:hypothetical protein
VLVECKPATQVATAQNQVIFAVARAWCAAHGYEFRVVTDAELRCGPRLENVKWLAQFRQRDGIASRIEGRLLATLAAGPTPMPLGQLVAALEGAAAAAEIVRHLGHLIYHHRIIVPLDAARITRDTPAWLPERHPA